MIKHIDMTALRMGRTKFLHLCVIATASCGVLSSLPTAASAQKDPDWPCNQPLVASLSLGSYWSAAPASADWRADKRVAAIVASAAPRNVPVAEAASTISAFADATPASERASVLAEVFQGLVDETNVQRAAVIARIKELARRQRELSRAVTELATELRAAAPDSEAATDLVQRREFATRSFQEGQRTTRYACEVPPGLDARLGQFARTLQERLGG